MRARRVRRFAIAPLGAFLGLLLATRAKAISLVPGDLLVNVPCGQCAILRVDPLTGAEATVTSGGYAHAIGIAVSRSGEVFFVAPGPGNGSVVRVDPLTGNQTVVSSGGLFRQPEGIAIEANGSLLVADIAARAVFRVDPVSGVQSVLATGNQIGSAFDIVVNPAGQVFITNWDLSVVQIDPVTGAQQTIGYGHFLGLGLTPSGEPLLATGGIGQSIVRVDPITHTQTVVSMGGEFSYPFDVATGLDGNYYVIDPNALGGIFRIDPMTGAQTALMPGSMRDFSGIVVVPVPEPRIALLVILGLAGLAGCRPRFA